MAPFPRALRVNPSATALEITWSDGNSDAIPCRTLREQCRCAECRSTRQKQQAIDIASDVTVTDAIPYGPNAVHLVFSDGHARGIFPFAFLRELAQLAPTTITR
jgi:DUF971 family protein